ncbi:MAG TPA: hypothetical protein ENH03_03800 [Candidatus Bathyarchaeota archaeon]|nr:hypothetical protein [Candidatus Bathyarchaeota archaeon]
MEKTKKSRKFEIMVFALATILGINLVCTIVLWQAYDRTRFDYETTRMLLQDLMRTVQATSQYVAVGNITLKFQPYLPIQKVSGTMITYLLGFVTVTNLTNIVVRPLTLVVTFEPNVTYPEWGEVTYEYTDAQTLEIPPGLNEVLMPWGAFPVTLKGFRSGDVINWDMTVTAIVQWTGIEVTRVSVEVTFKLIVQ